MPELSQITPGISSIAWSMYVYAQLVCAGAGRSVETGLAPGLQFQNVSVSSMVDTSLPGSFLASTDGC